MRRTHRDVYEILPQEPLPASPEEVLALLEPRVTAERRALFARVASQRKQGVVPVLEEIADPHNVAALLRSADAFGVPQVRVIAGPDGFFASRIVSKGSDRWLDLRREPSAEACAEDLRALGYRIVIATMDGRLAPRDLAAIPKVAIVFGNEHRGPSAAMRALADDTYAIPMVGFVESLNVSVAAAVTLHSALEGRPPVDEATSRALRAHFLLGSIKHGSEIVRRLLASEGTPAQTSEPHASEPHASEPP